MLAVYRSDVSSVCVRLVVSVKFGKNGPRAPPLRGSLRPEGVVLPWGGPAAGLWPSRTATARVAALLTVGGAYICYQIKSFLRLLHGGLSADFMREVSQTSASTGSPRMAVAVKKLL